MGHRQTEDKALDEKLWSSQGGSGRRLVQPQIPSLFTSPPQTLRLTPAVPLLFPDQNSLYLWVYAKDHPGIWSPGHNKGLLFYEMVFHHLTDPPFQSVHIKSAHPEISQMLAGFATMAYLVWYSACLCVLKIDRVGEAGYQTTWPTLPPLPPHTHLRGSQAGDATDRNLESKANSADSDYAPFQYLTVRCHDYRILTRSILWVSRLRRQCAPFGLRVFWSLKG